MIIVSTKKLKRNRGWVENACATTFDGGDDWPWADFCLSQRLAEAIGLQKMLTSIMRCDGDSDHFVGNSELEILAHRLDLIEGVPFTSQELCHQFGLEDDQSLLKLADVFLTLYIKKRREQVATNAKEGPRLSRSFIWKCEIDGLGVIAWELLKTKRQHPQEGEVQPSFLCKVSWLHQC